MPNIRQKPTTRYHLKVVKQIEHFGMIYKLSKYLPSKREIRIGNFNNVRITENYLKIQIMDNWEACLYFDSPLIAVNKLISFHQKIYGFGILAVHPITKEPCFMEVHYKKIYYKLK